MSNSDTPVPQDPGAVAKERGVDTLVEMAARLFRVPVRARTPRARCRFGLKIVATFTRDIVGAPVNGFVTFFQEGNVF